VGRDAIGRFRLTARLGAGAMGVVYAAFDPRLGRDVALKLLDAAAGTGAHLEASQLDARRQAALLEEARAAARVQHPNVVSIYDVIEDGNAVALAMELVDGGTLKDWLERPRDWRETAGVLLGAARGLLAVHEAGLLHRDFKPANVLVGVDGRARVSDFGLARPMRDGDAGTSGIVGTPAYMAPQQLQGAPPTTASDVYSFCATAWEAFFGALPRKASSLAELLDAVNQPPPPAPPSEVPGGLVEVLRAGLEPDPRRRPTLAAVISALEAALRPPAPPAARRLALAATVVAGLVVGSLLVARYEDEARCRALSAPEQLGAVPPRGEAFAAPWVSAWASLRADVCRARGEAAGLSAREREVAGHCLDGLKAPFSALMEALSSPRITDAQRESLAELGATLAAPQSCLVSFETPVRGADAAALMDAQASLQLGDSQAARARLEALLGRDGGVDARMAPLATYALGQALRSEGHPGAALETFSRAAALADARRDEPTRALALVAQASVLLWSLDEERAARAVLETARPVVERAGTTPCRVDVSLLDAELAKREADFDGALRAAGQAQALAASSGETRLELKAITRSIEYLVDRELDEPGVARAEELWARAQVLAKGRLQLLDEASDAWLEVLVAAGRTAELARFYPLHQQVLELQSTPRMELLRTLADWQVLRALGDGASAQRLLERLPRIAQRLAAAREELATIETDALWLLEGPAAAFARLSSTVHSWRAEASVEFQVMLDLLRFAQGRRPTGVESSQSSRPDQLAAWRAVRAFEAAVQGRPDEARRLLGAVGAPSLRAHVRANPDWAMAFALSAATRAALGERAEAGTEVAALRELLEAEPSSPRSRAFVRALEDALRAGCRGNVASLAPVPLRATDPVAPLVLEGACGRRVSLRGD
jgi:tetratricopeptide (TPR) repeat protein